MGRNAWQWHSGRQQYYLANFLPSQPELNWYNTEVVDAVLKLAEFWLDKGVDGFRVDAVNFFLHDAQLRDNPVRTKEMKLPDGIAPGNPMVKQQFVNSFCRPEVYEKLRPVRALLNQYPNVMSMGEVTLSEDSIALSGAYVKGLDRLHLAYNSSLLKAEPLSAQMLRDVLRRTLEHFPKGGECWMVGNHDYGRFRSRWSGHDTDGKPYPESTFHMMAALLTALPGALCLYQGDELGLPEARIPTDIPAEKIRDSFGKALYPVLPGRDGSRTPMPWRADALHNGFTEASEPWLPIPHSHHDLAVDRQSADPGSLLNTWRQLLHWRRRQPALLSGDLRILETDNALLALLRRHGDQILLCLFNTSPRPVDFPAHEHGLGGEPMQMSLTINVPEDAKATGADVRCPPYSAIFISR